MLPADILHEARLKNNIFFFLKYVTYILLSILLEFPGDEIDVLYMYIYII